MVKNTHDDQMKSVPVIGGIFSFGKENSAVLMFNS